MNIRKAFIKKFLAIFIPALFFIFLLTFSHFDRLSEYSVDEGMYFMRAYMHAKGYVLYKDIWMDQPPVLVLIFSFMIKLFGNSMYLARLLIMVFSATLLWSVYQIVSRTQNILSAISTLLVIILSPYYIKLSITAISHIPAFSFGMLSFYAIFLYQETRHRKYLFISGALLATALLTRTFTIIFFPAIIFEIFLWWRNNVKERKPVAKLINDYFIWFSAFFIVFIYISFFATSINFSQLFKPHVLARRIWFADSQCIIDWLISEYDLVLFAIGTLMFPRAKGQRFFYLFFIMFILAIFIAVIHRPLWYHYSILVFVPMCLFTSFGFSALCELVKNNYQFKNKTLSLRVKAAVILSVVSIVLLIARVPLRYDRVQNSINSAMPISPHVITLMKQYSKCANMVVTDRPVYAFLANIPTHPYLASVSKKRVKTNLLTSLDYLNIINKERPDIVLFARFNRLRQRVSPYLRKDYDLVYKEIYKNAPIDSVYLYLSKNIKKCF